MSVAIYRKVIDNVGLRSIQPIMGELGQRLTIAQRGFFNWKSKVEDSVRDSEVQRYEDQMSKQLAWGYDREEEKYDCTITKKSNAKPVKDKDKDNVKFDITDGILFYSLLKLSESESMSAKKSVPSDEELEGKIYEDPNDDCNYDTD
jgi:hypothetical protein